MKTVFIKSGGYYETPGVSVSGAIGDLLNDAVTHYNKADPTFLLDYTGTCFRIYPPYDQAGERQFADVNMELLAQKAEQYGFVYLGAVGDEFNSIKASELIRDMRAIAYCPQRKKLIDAFTDIELTGNNVTALAYFVKMTDNAYAMILSRLCVASSRVEQIRSSGLSKDMHVIAVNDGADIRSQFIDVRFDGAVKHFRNNDLTAGFAVFGYAGTSISLNLFKFASFITGSFKNSFDIQVDSNFDVKMDEQSNCIIVSLPPEKCTGYLSVKLGSTKLYEEISSREIKETLSFDFIVASI